MPEDIHSQPSSEEFASPLNSPNNPSESEQNNESSSAPEADQAATESPEQPATDRKADRKAQAKTEALGSYDALIENARKADVPGMAEALADLEAAKNIREQAIEAGLESLFEAKEAGMKEVLQRVVDFMHGDAKEAVALSSEDIDKLASIAVDYKAADGKTRHFRPFDKVEDTADMINATTKTLGITFPAESMKMLTYIPHWNEYNDGSSVTTGAMNGEPSFSDQGRLQIDGRDAYMAAGEKSPLTFDSNLGFRVEIDRKYNSHTRKDRYNEEEVTEERAGEVVDIFKEEYTGLESGTRTYDREFRFEIKMVRREEAQEN